MAEDCIDCGCSSSKMKNTFAICLTILDMCAGALISSQMKHFLLSFDLQMLEQKTYAAISLNIKSIEEDNFTTTTDNNLYNTADIIQNSHLQNRPYFVHTG
jgi:hypothetical protein